MSVKFKAIFLILFIFLIEYFVYIIFAPLISQEISASLFFYSIGKLAGLIGFLFLSILIISGDTARFFDRYFGINNIILFQRKFALITALFVIAHPIFFMLSNKSFSLIIPSFSSIPLALGVLAFYLFITIMISSLLYKRISHKGWQYLHILSYAMFFFALYHSIKTGSDTGLAPIKILNSVILLLFLLGVAYRTGYKIKQRFSEKFYVKEVKRETKDTFTVILKTKKKFFFKPGQFCFLRLDKKGLHARYPFTISSSPKEKDIAFTIKLGGRFTRELFKLREDDEVMVDGPFGIFTLDKAKENNLVFIAGGIGITPFFSMIKHFSESENKKRVILLYSSRKADSLTFKKELDAIKESWLKKVYIITEKQARINSSLIKRYIKNIEKPKFFICGSESMKENMTGELLKIGIRKDDILTESFFW